MLSIFRNKEEKEEISRIVRLLLKKSERNITPKGALLILNISKIEKMDIEEIISKVVEYIERNKINKLIIDEEDILKSVRGISQKESLQNKNARRARISKQVNEKRKRETYLGLERFIKKEDKDEGALPDESEPIQEEINYSVIADSEIEDKVEAVEATKEETEITLVETESIGERVKTIETTDEASQSIITGIDVESKDVEVEVLYNPTNIRFNESYDSFREMFLDRYRRIRKILLRKGLQGIVSSSEAKNISGDAEHHLIIMVYEKRTVRNGRGGIIVGEDEEGFITVYVPFRGNLMEKFNRVLNDSIIAVKFRRKNSDLIIAEDLIFPGLVGNGRRNRTEEPFKVVFISDIHFGSKQFLSKYFNNFIRFINGEIDKPWARKLTKDIKMLFLLGDIVDGVGVYPNQQEELSILDIYEQFDLAKSFLDKIKENIEIIAIPGNHDPAGKFIPQPPIPKEFIAELLDKPNFRMLGNPSFIKVNEVKILLYHGQGLEDIASSLNMSVERPTIMMVEELRNRHILPMWGEEPIIPSEIDPFVIDEMPDIYATGHLHMIDIWKTTTGGMLLLNSSTFQGLTSWQKKLGIKPTPGMFPIVDLKDFSVVIVKCDDRNCYPLKELG